MNPTNMTKKAKLELFDSVVAERDLLRLAVYDLRCNSRTPFSRAVLVDCAKEIDQDCPDRMRVSVSDRRYMPYYMVELLTDHTVKQVEFWTEIDLENHRDDMGIFWRARRHAAWKLKRDGREIA